VLSILAFILAVTCVLVVALNALISILADSYARVQADATANRRKEQAELVVEYLQLLPPWKRRQIEKDTKWFHTLLEVDADGDLLAESDDWQGGLNALRRDIEDLSDSNLHTQQRSLEQVKADIDSELSGFKTEIASLLENLSNDIKELHAMQSQGGITFSGKNVSKAVKSIGHKGSSVLGSKKKTT
jgi:F0F1-type ATP synthase membrane subunit b/b'